MIAEDVLFLTPEDDLNNNESKEKSKILSEKSFESRSSEENENQNGSINETYLELNITKNNDDILEPNEKEDHDELNETGEILDVRNENVPPVKIDEHLLIEMKYLFKNTRYFLIKSNNYENVFLAQTKVSFEKKC